MYGSMKLFDHDIVAIDKSNATISVRKGKSLHTIDLNACADNFKKEYGSSNGACVGDRKIDGIYFCFHTSGVKTRIYFKKIYVLGLFGKKILFGSRTDRFRQLERAIRELGFTTYDLS